MVPLDNAATLDEPSGVDRIPLHREWHGDPDSPRPALLLIHGGGSTIQSNWGLLLPRVARTRSVARTLPHLLDAP